MLRHSHNTMKMLQTEFIAYLFAIVSTLNVLPLVSQATLLRSFLGGQLFRSATLSSSVWSWSIPAQVPTGPATARSSRKIPVFPLPLCSASTHSRLETAMQMTQEKWPLWLETARLPLDSLSLVRMTPDSDILMVASYF